MHPVIAQAIVAERTSEIRAGVAATAHPSQLRRARRARLFFSTGAGRATAPLPVRRPLRGPRAA